MRTMDMIEQGQLRRDLPPFRSGDTVRVHVKVKEGEDADNIFAELMGDLVEPRKNFIQEHALTASVDV